MSVFDVIGIAGVAAIAGSYLLLQMDRLSARDPAYSVANGMGALLVLISLSRDFNLSAALIEGFWLAVSVYGLARSLGWRRDRAEDADGPSASAPPHPSGADGNPESPDGDSR